MARDADIIALRPVVPAAALMYRRFIIASVAIAVLVGFLLGIHIPVSRLMDAGSPERTADLVQAHGQAQLLGFAGLYVMGMSLRLLPRFAGARLEMESLVPLVLWTLVASLLARAAVLPWTSGDIHDVLFLGTQFGILLAASCFLLIVVSTLGAEARHVDASGIAFVLGGLVLFAAGVTAVLGTIEATAQGDRTLPYLLNTAVTQLQLLGFVLVVITGVALRALPVLVGHDRPKLIAAVLPVAVVAAVSVHAGSLLYLEYGSASQTASMVADAALVALGVVLILFVRQAGVLRPRANRARPSSQATMWLVRGAFFWLLVAALLMIYYGATSFADEQLFAQTDFDAVRHALGVGLITNLILGMSILILPEFAGERQQENRQRLLALALAVLVNLAALLRVAPAIAAGDLSYDGRNLSMALAGSLGEVALLLFGVYLLRLVLGTRGS
jgi:NnrS protein